MSRRDFTRNQREEIVERARRDGVIHCEGCGLRLGHKPYEIDHIIAEGLRSETDKQKRITISEGQLLGKECCHRGPNGKTNRDVKAIAKGKRQYARHNGMKTKPKQKLHSRNDLRTRQERPAKLPLPERRPIYQEVERK